MKKLQLVPKKKVAPMFMPYLCAILYIVIALFVVLCFTMKTPLWLIGVACLVILLVWFSQHFAWYKFAEVRKSNAFIVYETESLVNMLGHTKTRWDIHRIDKIHKKKDLLTVYGDLIVNEPFSKPKSKKKLVIPDVTDEVVDFLSSYRSNK